MTTEPTLRQLRYLVALSEDLHFGDAADRCGVSQPNMSAQIRELERNLGTQLLERSSRANLLTTRGHDVVSHAREVLRSVDQLCAVASAHNNPLLGRVRLGVIPTIAPYVLPRALPVVRKKYPQLELQLIEDFTERLLDRLDDGELDLAIIALPAERHFVCSAELGVEPFVALLPKTHPLASRTSIDSSSLDPHDLLLLQEGHCLRDQALEVCELSNRHRSTIEGSSLSTLIQMVANGLGVTLLPLTALNVDVGNSNEIAVLPFKKPQPGRTLGLVWRDSSPHAEAYGQLADLLRSQTATLLKAANDKLERLSSRG